MARLIYSAIASLDGYIADEDGNFDWAMPSQEAHAFINDLTRPIGTFLFGRRMYEVMAFWDAPPAEGLSAIERDFAEVWQGCDKVVFSRQLAHVDAPRTRLERNFDPATVRSLLESSDRDLAVGGPHLAAQALHAGLVDEIQLFLAPMIIGGGTSVFPDGLTQSLRLVDQRVFDDGMVHLRYHVAATT